jgi:ketosteroid isomerase-like protein
MKRCTTLILLTLLAVFSATLATSAQARPNEESIRSVLTRYDNAWNKKDVDDVSRILADDYVYFSSTGDLTRRKATLDFLASPDYKLTSVSRSEISVLSQNDRVAIVTSRWKGRGTYGKEEINDDQRCGLVFILEGKVWKLLSEHCVQIVSR